MFAYNTLCSNAFFFFVFELGLLESIFQTTIKKREAPGFLYFSALFGVTSTLCFWWSTMMPFFFLSRTVAIFSHSRATRIEYDKIEVKEISFFHGARTIGHFVFSRFLLCLWARVGCCCVVQCPLDPPSVHIPTTQKRAGRRRQLV